MREGRPQNIFRLLTDQYNRILGCNRQLVASGAVKLALLGPVDKYPLPAPKVEFMHGAPLNQHHFRVMAAVTPPFDLAA